MKCSIFAVVLGCLVGAHSNAAERSQINSNHSQSINFNNTNPPELLKTINTSSKIEVQELSRESNPSPPGKTLWLLRFTIGIPVLLAFCIGILALNCLIKEKIMTLPPMLRRTANTFSHYRLVRYFINDNTLLDGGNGGEVNEGIEMREF